MLPSGPGGVRRFSSRGAQPSTPPREAHSTRHALGRGFNPARADCGLQGTATSPSSTATSTTSSFQGLAEGAGFEPAAQGLPVHGISSAAPSAARSPLRTENWRRGEDLNPRGTYAPIRFRVGRLQPGSATPPRSLHLLLSKNALKSRAASSASTPPVVAARWLSRASSRSPYSDSTAPAFGSRAPYTTRATRA